MGAIIEAPRRPLKLPPKKHSLIKGLSESLDPCYNPFAKSYIKGSQLWIFFLEKSENFEDTFFKSENSLPDILVLLAGQIYQKNSINIQNKNCVKNLLKTESMAKIPGIFFLFC